MSAVADWNELPETAAVTTFPAREREIGPGDVLVGRYRLDEVIGRGGMATVYRGYDERLGRDVAVKVRRPDPASPQPPLQEERVASALIHDHIVSIFDAGEIPMPEAEPGTTFIVMEYVHGTTACDSAPAPWRRAVDIVVQAAEGLAAAHARGIVHCDVKPSNLLIDRNGRVLVADFGVAVEAASASGDYVHGSPAYIAPERLAGEPADPRMDVFGLGGVLAYLLTGEHPPVDRVPHLPPHTPSAVREVVARARAHEAARRYPDAGALRDALIAICAASQPRLPASNAEDVTLALTPTRRPGVERDLSRRASPVAVAAGPPGDRLARRPEPQGSAQSGARARRRSRLVPVTRGARRATLGRAGTLVAALVVALLIVFAGSVIVRNNGPVVPGAAPAAAAVEMPDVRGGTFGEAIEQLAEGGLTVTRVDVVYGPGPLNQVVAQEPLPGLEVTEGTEIVLVVRTGR
jgi:tRNA A-37 threonylcarbamoyl transferase component Bud32